MIYYILIIFGSIRFDTLLSITEIFNTQKPTIMGLLSLVYTKLNNLKSLLFQILMLICHRFPLINFEKKNRV
jgi:hypothetical protein